MDHRLQYKVWPENSRNDRDLIRIKIVRVITKGRISGQYYSDTEELTKPLPKTSFTKINILVYHVALD